MANAGQQLGQLGSARGQRLGQRRLGSVNRSTAWVDWSKAWFGHSNSCVGHVWGGSVHRLLPLAARGARGSDAPKLQAARGGASGRPDLMRFGARASSRRDESGGGRSSSPLTSQHSLISHHLSLSVLSSHSTTTLTLSRSLSAISTLPQPICTQQQAVCSPVIPQGLHLAPPPASSLWQPFSIYRP
ncbi:hypothetical protein Acr_04g0001890 [Actinidia rufa]|uniref:Uncharacterized protein n=1 Tax=Actinidia rufa TaxID=165716 RepID=A0A7J0EG71_9ERIC|nr:hypothetical protein Acr_04g0001890 [Actinidia rufa]